MGIGLNSVHLLGNSLPVLGELASKKILTLGVQDCAFRYEEILQFLCKHKIHHRPVPENELILTSGFRWLPPVERRKFANCVHQTTLFRLLGFSSNNIYSIDYSDYEGANIVHDLNLPVEEKLAGKFDLIYDGGTLEHVFSVKDVFFNMNRLCKIGGMVVHVSPVDLINHGFLNVNAELFHDFYLSNGFEQVKLIYFATPAHPKLASRYYLEYEPKSFHHSLNPFYATHVFSVFKKMQECLGRIPTQGYYSHVWSKKNIGEENENSNIIINFVKRVLRRELRSLIDKWFFSSVLVRGYLSIRRGRKVLL